MAFSVSKRAWWYQPDPGTTLDLSNTLLNGVKNAFTGVPGGTSINLGKMKPWTVSGTLTQFFGLKGQGPRVDSTHFISSGLTPSPPVSGWTTACILMPVGSASQNILGFCDTPGSNTFDRQIRISSNWEATLFDGGTKTATSAVLPVQGRADVIVATGTPSTLNIYVNGLSPVTTATANSGFQGWSSQPSFVFGNSSNSNASNISVILCLQINRPWSAGEAREWMANPWQVYRPRPRRLWFAPTQTNNMVGGATLNLSKITEQGTGITGSVGSATDTLKALTEQATGITGTVGSARDNLKAILESAFGKTGAVGFGTETLKPITVQATGTVQSNNVVGGATLTLKALLESGTGRTGVVGSARDSLRAITEQGTGKTGSVGSGQIILKPITVQAFGESGATPLAPADTSRPGGQAWWGYESFDGSSRPWWYKDLKDKACELERLRQQRIEIGLIPPDKVEETVEEVLEFVEEQPTPATADYYVHRAEMLAARVEKLIDNMMEEDDEQAIMEMSKFFFHRKEVTPWQSQ